MNEYQITLKSMLDRIPNDIDKREGSIIYDTLAPVALQLTIQNFMLDNLFNLMFADTAVGEWLDRVTNDFGVNREQPTYSLRKITLTDRGSAPFDVKIGSRFAFKDLTFKLTEKIAIGEYKALCEQIGTVGNMYSGEILPVDNINGLGLATLHAEPLISARDLETDEHLRQRFYIAVRQVPYGGNLADYERKTLEIEGVGAVKVFNAKEIRPGHVGIVIADELGKKATAELINKVQTLMGINGEGIAPVGHTVTVKTSTDLVININADIKLKTGASFDIIKPIIENTITDYINGIGFKMILFLEQS